MRINEATENYLEAILILEEKDTQVRMSDVAKMLKVSKPSVNKALGVLKDAGYILHQKYGTILLTDEGREYAQKVYDRHKLFKRFFVEVLEVEEEIAEEEACHMEHCISDSTMEKLNAFLTQIMDEKKI